MGPGYGAPQWQGTPRGYGAPPPHGSGQPGVAPAYAAGAPRSPGGGGKKVLLVVGAIGLGFVALAGTCVTMLLVSGARTKGAVEQLMVRCGAEGTDAGCGEVIGTPEDGAEVRRIVSDIAAGHGGYVSVPTMGIHFCESRDARSGVREYRGQVAYADGTHPLSVRWRMKDGAWVLTQLTPDPMPRECAD